jgi:hypothetical protein
VVKSERPIKIALLLSTRKIEIQHLRHGFGSKPKTMSRTENDSDTDSQTERDLLAEYPQGTAAKLIKTDRVKRNSCHSWDCAIKLKLSQVSLRSIFDGCFNW